MNRPRTAPERDLRQTLMQLAVLTNTCRPGLGWHYASIEALVLAHGRFVDVTRVRTVHRGPMRECFRNALNTAAANDDFTYVEGYAALPNLSLPILHAWCIDAGGALVEPTWHEPGAAYLGIPFALPFVLNTVGRRNRYGVIDAYELRWPLLQHGLPDGAVAVSRQTAGGFS